METTGVVDMRTPYDSLNPYYNGRYSWSYQKTAAKMPLKI